MSLSEWSTGWRSRCAGVWRTNLQGTWSSAALRSPTSPADIDVQPTCTVWLFHGVDEAQSAVGRLLCWGSVSLELTACRTVWADCQLRRLLSHIKNHFVRAVLCTQRSRDALHEIVHNKSNIDIWHLTKPDRQTDRQTSPRCESAQCPFVSGSAITTFTPGNNYIHTLQMVSK